MSDEVIHLAEEIVNTSGGAGETLAVAIVTGAVSILLALISVWGLSKKISGDNRNVNPQLRPHPEDEPKWVQELRNSLKLEQQLRRDAERQADTYERMLYMHGIDPRTGRKMAHGQS